jgi:gamma-glutamyltranspeptidase
MVCSDGNNLSRNCSVSNILTEVSSILFKSEIYHNWGFKLNNRITQFNLAPLKSNVYGM